MQQRIKLASGTKSYDTSLRWLWHQTCKRFVIAVTSWHSDSARGTYTWLIHTNWNLTGNLAQLLRSNIAQWFRLIMKNCVCLVQWSTCSLSRTEVGLTAVKSITPATGGCPLLPMAEMLVSSKTPRLLSLALTGSRTKLISSSYLVQKQTSLCWTELCSNSKCSQEIAELSPPKSMLSLDYYSVYFSHASSLDQRPHFHVLYKHITGGIMPLSYSSKLISTNQQCRLHSAMLPSSPHFNISVYMGKLCLENEEEVFALTSRTCLVQLPHEEAAIFCQTPLNWITGDKNKQSWITVKHKDNREINLKKPVLLLR